MKKTGFLAIVIIALLASGGLFLLTWDIPPQHRPSIGPN